MQRLLLFASVLLLGASWAAAQDSTAPGTSSGQTSSQVSASQSDSSGAGTQSVEGCLSGSNGKYTLTDSQGKSYDLAGDTSKLANHVGHEVKISGTVSSGSASSSGSQMGSSSGQTLEVTSMKHIAKTCKNAGGGMSH